MKMNDSDQREDEFMNEPDEFLLQMTEKLNQELNEITVSEDLIAKTLKAVELENKKLQDSKSEDIKSDDSKSEDMKSEDEKSKVLYYDDAKASVEHKKVNKKDAKKFIKVAMRFMEVAVACFVLFIGAKFVSSIEFGNKETKSDLMTPMEMTSDEACNETAAAQMEEPVTESTEGAESRDDFTKMDSDQEQAGKSKDTTESPEVTVKQNLLAPPASQEEKVSVTTAGEVAVEAAIEAAKAETQDETMIHTYQGEASQETSSKLLLLFSQDNLKLCSEEAVDDWTDYIIVSMEENSAILYKVGKNQYVIAQTYEGTEVKSETVYQVKDMETFRNSLDTIMNQ